MTTEKIIYGSSRFLIGFSAFAIFMVCLMAFINPQSVMDLVQVKLCNNDAFSSIRGVYGGVSLTLVVLLIYLWIKNVRLGLAFISLLWGSYALSRTITIFAEGPLGAFGTQWLIIESTLCMFALLLLVLLRNASECADEKSF
jgi:hypothetical protein